MDRSLEAYKESITGMTKALTGKDDTSMNDAQWEASWKRFWEKAQPPTHQAKCFHGEAVGE
jgi:hypothetical protein